MVNLIVGSLIAGIIIGPLARLVLPGKQDVSLLLTIVLGAVGALAGGLIYDAIGGSETEGIDWILHLIQVIVAAAAILAYLSMQGRPARR